MYTYYEYEYNGNKTFEGYISLKNPLSVAAGAKDYYQYANISSRRADEFTLSAEWKPHDMRQCQFKPSLKPHTSDNATLIRPTKSFEDRLYKPISMRLSTR